MILVDTSVWIDHLRKGDERLRELLERGQVLCHPFVIGELAMRHLKQRDLLLGALADLPKAEVPQEHEVLHFVAAQGLFGFGIGYVDAHLLAAARITAGAQLWTRDRRLLGVAKEVSVAYKE